MVDVERIGSRLDRLEHLIELLDEIDDHEVFAALGRLDDLRRFAAVTQRLADSG